MNILRGVSWLFVAVYATIPVYWLVIHPFPGFWRGRKGAVMPMLGSIWLGSVVLAALATWPLLDRLVYATPWSSLAALVMAIPGLYIYRQTRPGFTRAQLIGQAEVRPEEHPQVLVTTGLRQKVRHPIYSGHFLMMTAWTAAGGTLAHYALWSFGIITGALMVHFEEKELVQRFGDAYREYQHTVPAIFPRF
ncbi:MAG: isoprenylcysteine carboxylmethyltransferase family protein [Acidobacteriales bacterium]|nr:isoprenylcysteine carboxylmethyltransferase family protein [Terriglobales bacterium]